MVTLDLHLHDARECRLARRGAEQLPLAPTPLFRTYAIQGLRKGRDLGQLALEVYFSAAVHAR
jgi:hypothetical protein